MKPGVSPSVCQSRIRPMAEGVSAAIKAVLSDKELRQKVLNAGIELTFSNSHAEFLAFRAQPGGDAVIRTIGLKLVCLPSHRVSPAGMPRRGGGSPGVLITAQTRTAWPGYACPAGPGSGLA